MELNTLALTRLIDQFLTGELDEPDMQEIRSRMEANEQFREQVALQQDLYEAVARAGIRMRIKRIARNYHSLRLLKWVAIGLAIIAASVAAWMLVNPAEGGGAKGDAVQTIDKSLRNKLDETMSFERTPTQYFRSSGAEVFVSEGGVLLSVVEGSFLEDGNPYTGEYLLRFQEALAAGDIVRAGLSTKSGDSSLYTKGMFAVHAFTESGEPLQINPEKGVYVQVPVDEYDEKLRIFEGVKKNGTIDWQSEKRLEKMPLQADMSALDFYPPGYEPVLDSLHWLKGKKSRDSLYLSFDNFPETDNPVKTAVSGSAEDTLVEPVSGEQLFLAKCATCHARYENSTGPKLAGTREKWRRGGAKPGSLNQWVKNREVAASNDPYAQNASMWSPSAMPRFPELSDEQIDAIFDYVDSGSGPGMLCGIPPAQVLGFWKKEFNGTLLATKDFEKRMRLIHETSDPKVLRLYLDNLRAAMWRIDKFAAAMGYPQFEDFAAEQVGTVNADNPHLANLAALYKRSVASLKQLDANRKKARKRVEEAFDRKMEHMRKNDARTQAARSEENGREEYELNMGLACAQLGKKNGRAMRTLMSASVGATITSAGAYNLDAFVREATSLRRSGTYVDPETGLTVKLDYTEASFEVENAGQFIHLYAYFVPDELSNFERIDAVCGTITRSLNDAIHYNLIVVGVGESDLFTFTTDDPLAPGNEKITLQKTGDKALQNKLEKLLKSNSEHHNFKSQLRFWKSEQADYREQKKRKDEKRFRSDVGRAIFPCRYGSETDQFVFGI